MLVTHPLFQIRKVRLFADYLTSGTAGQVLHKAKARLHEPKSFTLSDVVHSVLVSPRADEARSVRYKFNSMAISVNIGVPKIEALELMSTPEPQFDAAVRPALQRIARLPMVSTARRRPCHWQNSCRYSFLTLIFSALQHASDSNEPCMYSKL